MVKDQSSPASDGAPDSSASQRCVLLVEDDRSLRRYLEVALQRAGYRVIATGDGIEALQQAHSSPVDIVITDAIMPQLSGQQLATMLRGNPKFARVPIVLLTGQDDKSTLNAAGAAIDAFLYKPLKPDELRTCVAKLLNENQK
jgi:DNA-binding response OmpR family regulator